MKNNKGIALISLAITIVFIFLLATIVITTSIQSLRRMSLENFKNELEEVQRKVDEKAKDYANFKKINATATYKDYFINIFGTAPNFLKDNEKKAEAVIKANPLLETNKKSDLVFYFTEKDVKQYLGLNGIGDIIVDFSTRYVYSVKGCRDPDNNQIYYSAKDYGGNLVVAESNKTNSILSDSETLLKVKTKINLIGNVNLYPITINVISKLEDDTNYPLVKVYYSKGNSDNDSWIEIDDLNINNNAINFILYDIGVYKFKVVDSSGAFKISDKIQISDELPDNTSEIEAGTMVKLPDEWKFKGNSTTVDAISVGNVKYSTSS